MELELFQELKSIIIYLKTTGKENFKHKNNHCPCLISIHFTHVYIHHTVPCCYVVIIYQLKILKMKTNYDRFKISPALYLQNRQYESLDIVTPLSEYNKHNFVIGLW